MKNFFKGISKFFDNFEKILKIIGIVILGIIVLVLTISILWNSFSDTTDFNSFKQNLFKFLGTVIGAALLWLLIHVIKNIFK